MSRAPLTLAARARRLGREVTRTNGRASWRIGLVALVAGVALLIQATTAVTAGTRDISALGGPPNDFFVNATPIEVLPFADSEPVTGATTETGEPSPTDCEVTGQSVWYRYTPTVATKVGIDTKGSDYSTVMTIYRGTSLNALTEIACSYDVHGSVSDLILKAKAGVTYQIQISSQENDAQDLQLHAVTLTPPGNDASGAATNIATLPFQSTAENIRGATESGEPVPACVGANEDVVASASFGAGQTVWYRFTPSSAMTLAADTQLSDFAGFVAVYRGSGLTPVACGGDGDTAFRVQAGKTYYLQAGGDYGGQFGTLTLRLKSVTSPANDDFDHAQAITSVPFNASVSTDAATTQTGEPTPSCAQAIGQTVWYSYHPSSDTNIRFDTSGSSFYVTPAIYQGNDVAHLTELGCGSSSAFHLAGGTTYWIQAGGANGDSGDVALAVSSGTAPGNDDIAAATHASSLPYAQSLDTTYATNESGEALGRCVPSAPNGSIWYRYKAPADGYVRADTLGSTFDTVVDVFSGSASALTPVSCDDDVLHSTDSDYRTSSVAFQVTGGTTYWIQIGGYSSSIGTVYFHLDQITPPPNDAFAHAKTIAVGYTHSVDLSTATHEPHEPTASCNEGTATDGSTVWYRYHATANAEIYFDGGSDFDVVIAVFTGTSLRHLTEVGCENDLASWDPHPGTTYWIQASGFNGSSGELHASFNVSP